jgi:hypothetical protein
MKINKKISLQLKSRVSFSQMKPILDIFLCGSSLSSCPQHSLKVLLLLNPTCLLKYVLNCEQVSFFIFRSGLARVYCTVCWDPLLRSLFIFVLQVTGSMCSLCRALPMFRKTFMPPSSGYKRKFDVEKCGLDTGSRTGANQ